MRGTLPRPLLLLALAAALLLLPGSARAAEEVLHARVGEPFLLKFPANQEAGFQWTLNETESRGAHLVTVDQIGWTLTGRPSSLLNPRPATLSISVLPKAPGEAHLAFDYIRPWGSKVLVRTKVVRVVIAPASQ